MSETGFLLLLLKLDEWKGDKKLQSCEACSGVHAEMGRSSGALLPN